LFLTVEPVDSDEDADVGGADTVVTTFFFVTTVDWLVFSVVVLETIALFGFVLLISIQSHLLDFFLSLPLSGTEVTFLASEVGMRGRRFCGIG